MHKRILSIVAAMVLASVVAHCQSGHWEGSLRIEDHQVALILDLSQKDGTWMGSTSFPDQQSSPIQLSKIEIVGSSMKLECPALMDFNATIDADQKHMHGTVQMGRHRRTLQLTRTAAPQLSSISSTMLGQQVEGSWLGTLKYGKTWGDMTPPEGQTPEGASFDIRLRFTNGADGRAVATLTRLDENAELPLDLVTQNGNQIRFESFSAVGVFIGTLEGDEIRGVWRQIGAEPMPLVLKKS